MTVIYSTYVHMYVCTVHTRQGNGPDSTYIHTYIHTYISLSSLSSKTDPFPLQEGLSQDLAESSSDQINAKNQDTSSSPSSPPSAPRLPPSPAPYSPPSDRTRAPRRCSASPACTPSCRRRSSCMRPRRRGPQGPGPRHTRRCGRWRSRGVGRSGGYVWGLSAKLTFMIYIYNTMVRKGKGRGGVPTQNTHSDTASCPSSTGICRSLRNMFHYYAGRTRRSRLPPPTSS